MTNIQKAILRTLLYYEIFGHPLKKSELFSLIGVRADWKDYEQSLSELQDMNLVGSDSEFYFIVHGTSSIEERARKQERARKYHRVSRFISTLIYFNPYVKGVLVSGSLSKSAFSKKDDIDYFIITEPGRLWLCRALLMMFKKLFLLNSKKYFCINYLIDSKTLEIPEKNIFTATEIAFLIPLRNIELCREFFAANEWIHTFFPNLKIDLSDCREASEPAPKKWLERLLWGKALDRIDSWFMDLYSRRSVKKYYELDKEHFTHNFTNEKNVSKYHPNGFQHKILKNYGLKISEFQAANQLDLTL